MSGVERYQLSVTFSGSSVKNVVQQWYTTPSTNYGFMIRYTDESKSNPDYNSFWSSENGVSLYMPILMIDYNVPQPTISEGTYLLRSVYSGKYLSVNESTGMVVQRTFDGATNQKWTVVYKGNGYYEVISGTSTSGSTVLDVDNAGTSNGTPLKRFTRNDSTAQRFAFIDTSNGVYKIVPQNATNKVLDVTGPSTADNTQIQLYDWGNVSQQKWILESAVWSTSGDGAYNVNSPWGFRQYDSKHHQGIDISVNQKSVYAIADGTVITASSSCLDSQGIYIVIRHELNGVIFYSRYMHLREIASGISSSPPNNIVTIGKKIGTSGNTIQNGPDPNGNYHLHFQIQFENISTRSETINPLPHYHWDDKRSTSSYDDNPNPFYVPKSSGVFVATPAFSPSSAVTYLAQNHWSISTDTTYKNW